MSIVGDDVIWYVEEGKSTDTGPDGRILVLGTPGWGKDHSERGYQEMEVNPNDTFCFSFSFAWDELWHWRCLGDAGADRLHACQPSQAVMSE